MKTTKAISLGLRTFGFIIIAYILYNLNLRETLYRLQNIDISVYVAGLSLFAPMLLIKAIRWRYLLAMHAIGIRCHEATIFYASGMFVGAITPGRLGELIKALYIKEKGFSSAKAFVAVIEDRILDVLCLLIIGLASILFLTDVLHGTTKTVMPGIRIVLLCTCLFLLCAAMGLRTAILKKYISSSVKASFKSLLDDFGKMHLRNWLRLIGLTAISWLIYFLQMFFFAKSLSLDIAFLDLCAAVSIATIVSLLPITIAGIGTRDATLIFLLGKMGMTREAAIAFSALIMIMLSVNICICSLGWFLNRQQIQLSAVKHNTL